MNQWLALSLEIRYLVLALLGACVGSFVNWGIYTFAWFNPRPISPWSPIDSKFSRRTALDLVPVLGWLTLRREAIHFGAGHWIRPLLLELAFTVGFPLLYGWEVAGLLLPAAGAIRITADMIHAQYVAHVLLITLMTVATFIDFDEQTIPDAITIPGVLLGLTLITFFPAAFSLVIFSPLNGPPVLEPLWFNTEPLAQQPPWVAKAWGLCIAIGCFVGWCYALVPKTCTLRRGLWKGIVYLHASMLRGSAWWKMGLLAVIGCGYIVAIWSQGGERWSALFTSLVGMAFGGGMIWAVRIVGFVALRKEAMGFGDVTLMCVIGSFLGWQASLMVFFLAPMAAVMIAIIQTLFTGRRDIAFGPYLCVGALILILYWKTLWVNHGAPVFELGWLVPAMLFSGLLLMMGLLMLWRIIENALHGADLKSTDR
jgi:prepilin signal peptidase PulO-like enzyme (type II secretory pathway)